MILKLLLCSVIIVIAVAIVFAPIIISLMRLVSSNHSDQMKMNKTSLNFSFDLISEQVKKEASKLIEFFLIIEFYLYDVTVSLEDMSKEIRYALKYQDEVDRDHRIILYREEILELEEIGQVRSFRASLISSVTSKDFEVGIANLDLDNFYQETIAVKYDYDGVGYSSLKEIRNSKNLATRKDLLYR